MSAEDTTTAQAGATPEAPAGRTYTQDQINAMIESRVGRERDKFKDYEDIKARAARADELEQSQASETDKLRSKAEREAEKRAAAEEKASKASERADNALKRAAVVAAAAQANAADPGDVFTLLDKSTLVLDDEGNVEGVKDAVEALLKAKPHLIRRSAGGGFDGGQKGSPASQGPSMNDRIRGAMGFGPS